MKKILPLLFLIACHEQPKFKKINHETKHRAIFLDSLYEGRVLVRKIENGDTVYLTWQRFDSLHVAYWEKKPIIMHWLLENRNILMVHTRGDSIPFFDSLRNCPDCPKFIEPADIDIHGKLVYSAPFGVQRSYVTSWGRSNGIYKFYVISPHDSNVVDLLYQDLRTGKISDEMCYINEIPAMDKKHGWEE